jgi:hypothetical protein
MVRIVGIFLLAVAGMPGLRAQHYHLNAGASAPAAGTKLLFQNGTEFDTNSAFFVRLQKNATNGFAGEYVGNISMTSLSADPLAPEPGHAAPGAFLEVEVVSVQGPAGATLSFWDRNIVEGQKVFSVPAGTLDGTNRVTLSEGDGSPGSDPYGHVHGRNWSASAPGSYSVGLRIIDTSENGTNGGPLHEASDMFYIYFQADITAGVRVEDGIVKVRFPKPFGATWALERRNGLASGAWETVVAPNIGDDRYSDYPAAAETSAFYRVRGD